MKKRYMTRRRANAIVASALAVTLAIPSSVFFGNAKAAFAEGENDVDLPEAVATYDFERGFRGAGYDASGNALKATVQKSDEITQYYLDEDGTPIVMYNANNEELKAVVSNQPTTVNDAERGNVFMLQDSVKTVAAYEKKPSSFAKAAVTDASGNVIIATGDALDESGNKINKTNATVTTAYSDATLDNPFAAYKDELVEDRNKVDLSGDTPDWQTGVTVAYWVKTPAATGGATVAKDSSILYFETNEIDPVVQKDDEYKYRLGKDYHANPSDPKFSVGTKEGTLKVKTKAYSNGANRVAANSGKNYMNFTKGFNVTKCEVTEAVGNGLSVSNDVIKSVNATVDNAYVHAGQKGKITAITSEAVTMGAVLWDSNFWLEDLKKFKKGDQFATDKGYVFTIEEADETGDGRNTVFSYETEIEVDINKDVGVYAAYNPTNDGSAYTLFKKGDTYELGKATSQWGNRYDGYGLGSELFEEGSNVRAGHNDTASLAFNLSGTWAFIESPTWVPLYKFDKLDGNYVNSGNRAFAFAGTTSVDDPYNDTVASASLVNKPDEWHFVTYVITNSYVSTYYDGELMDELLYHDNTGKTGITKDNQFNLGFGYSSSTIVNTIDVAANPGKNPFSNPEALDGADTPGVLGYNSYNNAMTIMELLTREDTKIHLGGQSLAAQITKENGYSEIKDGGVFEKTKALGLGMNVGTAYGTCIDDLSFYVEPMTEEQVAALYEQAKATESKEVKPIKSYNFAAGDEVTGVASNDASGSVAEPEIVKDASMGAVLKLGAGTVKETSAVKLDNPFKGDRELTGVSVGYWVKEEPSDKGVMKDTTTISFVDTPKPITHEKLDGDKNGTEATSALFTSTTGTTGFAEGYSSGLLSGSKGSLNNQYTYTTGISTEPESDIKEWHYFTMVVTNSEIKIYRDGELVENTNTQLPGGRFYDGYYTADKDYNSGIIMDGDKLVDKRIFGGTNNTGATSVLSFLTDETTDLYLGYLMEPQSSKNFKAGSAIYIDCIDLYDMALTQEQVAEVYEEAKKVLENGGDSTNVKIGDADGNGEIDSDDAVIILKQFAGLEPEGINMEAADVDGNGEVDSDDAVEVLKFFAGLGSEYIPEE